MRQIVQSLRDGQTAIVDVPVPTVAPGRLLISTTRTIISAGTERMLVEFGRSNLLQKARQQPDRVRATLEKIRTDGVLPTIEVIQHRLDQPLPLGYANAGVVRAIGPGTTGFAVGDRVVSNGGHAEWVSVPTNLCARVPDDVPDDQAAFTSIAAIALQSVRLAQPALGESVAVIGLGLVGLIAVQLLRASGCRVLGIDLDRSRLELANRFGAETVDISAGHDPVATARSFSRERGMDAVIVATSTASNTPVHQAAGMCRQRGRVVLVGTAGLELSRADFYKKELTFQVSSSYGPGRYDPEYEDKNRDYPIGFVRWTAQRNFEAVLDMMATGRLDVGPLISHRFGLNDSEAAYQLLASKTASLGIVLEYDAPSPHLARETGTRAPRISTRKPTSTPPRVAFIGAGNYATGTLMPAFRSSGARLAAVTSLSGVSAVHAQKRHGFECVAPEIESILADSAIDAVVIATRHDTHASLVCQAIAAGKAVFVEKPLALRSEEIDAIASTMAAHRDAFLMVGFNRRFAPQTQRVHQLLSGTSEPKAAIMTVNAGHIASGHWIHDPEVGGGRIIGEGCHFIDLLRFLIGVPVVASSRVLVSPDRHSDSRTLNLEFSDGSAGSIHYLTNGSKGFPKERLEVFVGGRILQLENFRRLTGFGWPQFSTLHLWRQDKGQRACVQKFVDAVRLGEPSPTPFDQLVEVSRLSIDLAN